MAVTSAQVAVDDSAAVSLNTQGPGQRLIIQNDGAEVAHLGASNVTSSTGLEVAAAATVTVELQPGEELFAISTVTGTTLHVLRTGA